MVYNQLRDKVKSFLQPFAESGQAVGAEDIKAYFEKLRGDDQAIRLAAAGAGPGTGEDGGDGSDNRKEQSGESLLFAFFFSSFPFRIPSSRVRVIC